MVFRGLNGRGFDQMGGLQADGKDLIGHEGFDQMGGVWSDARGRLNLFFKIYAKT